MEYIEVWNFSRFASRFCQRTQRSWVIRSPGVHWSTLNLSWIKRELESSWCIILDVFWTSVQTPTHIFKFKNDLNFAFFMPTKHCCLSCPSLYRKMVFLKHSHIVIVWIYFSVWSVSVIPKVSLFHSKFGFYLVWSYAYRPSDFPQKVLLT